MGSLGRQGGREVSIVEVGGGLHVAEVVLHAAVVDLGGAHIIQAQ